jgi:integrase
MRDARVRRLVGEHPTNRIKKKRSLDHHVPSPLAEALTALQKRDKYTAPEDAVFASRSGLPVDEHNVMRRRLRKVATSLAMPWIGWHDLRRTFATLADQVGMSAGERQAFMDHANAG